MTPAARVAAAAEILDRILDGSPAEQALLGWSRSSRFAGSGDRAAVRDLVFQALRQRRSLGALSGGGDGASGRQLMLGLLVDGGSDPASVFTGERHAPAPLTVAEQAALKGAAPLETWPDAVRLDVPDWLHEVLRHDLGAEAGPVLLRLRDRAPVFLRVNRRVTDRAAAMAALSAEGIEARPHALAPTALEVTANAGRLRASIIYAEGRVEVQDAASQAICELLPLYPAANVLDYCAGGGGKTLALAAREPAARFTAHDAIARRMADLPARAARAGVRVGIVATSELPRRAPFDLVVADVPCSGSGTWSRDPEAKWRLTPAALEQLARVQEQILRDCAPLVRPGGMLAYFTCSLLARENEAQVTAFLSAHPGWHCETSRRLLPTEGGDGFFAAILTRSSGAPTTSEG
ncbi:MAG: hypothetical protein RLZZ528_1903 [Pseudomonadota bacterium]